MNSTVSKSARAISPIPRRAGTVDGIASFLTTHRDKYDIWMGAKVNLHLWKGELPKGLGDGKHQLEVRIVEKNGEQYGGVHFLEVNTLAKTKIKG